MVFTVGRGTQARPVIYRLGQIEGRFRGRLHHLGVGTLGQKLVYRAEVKRPELAGLGATWGVAGRVPPRVQQSHLSIAAEL